MTEAWRPVVGYEGRYEVSNIGRVRSMLRGILRPTEHETGYMVVSLARPRRQRKVHQLMLEAFVGPRPPGQYAFFGPAGRSVLTLANLSWRHK